MLGLVGKAFAAVVQAGVTLHTMVVLQAYQSNLLKDINLGEGVSPDAVLEIGRATDLAFWAFWYRH